MPIGSGAKLGPYEITGAIGAGGMGEVWLARDTRLARDVAIKVLPAELAQDPERLARFEREAKLLASLNHPNIAHVYGFESATLADGSSAHFLAMELVPGEDLAERLKRGAIPVDEALAIAKQIAEALEEAHEHGIVHRDLKPGNVKLTPDGKVKVLDFGLAKAWEGPGAASSDLSQSPTLAHTGTAAGLILGTAAYMSPEQARGKAVDKRADIWAFGVVLWEMLTGRKLFVGETVSDVLAGVLTRDPALDDLPSGTPGAVRRLVRRCLERDATRRLRDIGEARLALAEPDVATVRDAPLRTRALPWLAAAVGVGLGLFGLLRTQARSTATASAPTLRFTLLPPPPGEIEGFPAISPDGQSIVFGLLPASGVPQLWALSLTTGESRPLPDTEHGTDPFWSPDGRFVGYFSRGQLRRLELATGLARALAPASDPRGGAWSENGEIFFTPNSSAGLFRLPADGGTPTRITKLDPSGAESHRYPTVLPGGRAIVYASMGDKSEKNGLFWLSLADGRTKRLAAEVSRTHYDPRGYLLWARQGALVAQRLEPGTGELAGEPFRIAEGVGTDAQRYGMTWFGAAAGIVATRVGTSIATQLRWYDRGGRRLADVTAPGIFFEPALSPDGRSVAVSVGVAGSPRGDIWIFDVAGKDRGRRLTFGGVSTPAWTPDGQWVIYSSRDPSGASIVRKRADGSGAGETLHVVPGNAYVDSVSPRAPLLSLEAYDEAGNVDILFLSLEGERKVRPFLATPAAEGHGAFSPDGRLLAYTSDESGLPQICAKEISGAGSRWQLTTDGGDQAVWSADGTEIFYVGLDRVLRALPVLGTTPFRFGEPKPLFKLDIPALSITGNRTFYAVSSDRRRFLVNTLVAGESAPGLQVVLNWRAPVGGER